MRRILPQLTAAMAMGRRVNHPSNGTPGAVKSVQLSIAPALRCQHTYVRSAVAGAVIGVDTRDFELRPREVELDFHSGLDIREARGLRLIILCGQINSSMCLCKLHHVFVLYPGMHACAAR